MKDLNKSDLWTALAPTYTVTKIFGTGQFTVSGPCNKRKLQAIHYCSFYKIVSCLVIAVFLIVLCSQTNKVTIDMTKSPIENYLKMYLLLSLFIAVASELVFNMIYRYDVIAMYEKVAEIDNIFLNINNKAIDNKKSRNFNLISIIITCIIAISTINWNATVISNFWLLANSIIYLVIFILKFLITITFRSWLYSLNQRFYAINNYLSTCTSKNIHFTYDVEVIKSIAKIHFILCTVVKDLGEFGFAPLVISFTTNFAMVVSSTFFVIFLFMFSISDKKFTLLFNVVFQLLINLSDTLLVIGFSDDLGKKGIELKNKLFKLLLATRNVHLKKEIQAFSLQLLHENSEVSAKGFFTIDMTLLFSMMAAGCTYVIILFQFDALVDK